MGWKPLLYQEEHIGRWARVFDELDMIFDEADWPTKP
ncbi:uncharacterized protein METZ01_LOCUS357989 [marine metagenome]|uniref:Uncharacterized protein n=1 Tax=marine metagenome TaxID=408172 RepID=A0A382S6R4_9ZZZZ